MATEPTAPALLRCRDREVPLSADEWVVLSTLNFLYGHQGGVVGRLLATGGDFTRKEVADIRGFVGDARAHANAPLVVYTHGRGQGTMRDSDSDFVALIQRLGLRYQKTVARYVQGQPGLLDRDEQVVYAKKKKKNVSQTDPTAQPQTLGEVLPQGLSSKSAEEVAPTRERTR